MTDNTTLSDVLRQLESRTAVARRLEIALVQSQADLSTKRAQLYRAAALLKMAGQRLADLRDESDLVDQIGLFLVEIGE